MKVVILNSYKNKRGEKMHYDEYPNKHFPELYFYCQGKDGVFKVRTRNPNNFTIIKKAIPEHTVFDIELDQHGEEQFLRVKSIKVCEK